MKRNIWISVLGILWAFMLVKTILAVQYHDLSPTAHYYGAMLQNTWQAHFNVDLWIHSALFACWIFYREKSKMIGAICGLAAIYLGAIFSLLYLISVFIRSKGKTDLLFNGNKVTLT